MQAVKFENNLNNSHFASRSLEPEKNTEDEESPHPTSNVLCLVALGLTWVASMIYICVVIIIYHSTSE